MGQEVFHQNQPSGKRRDEDKNLLLSLIPAEIWLLVFEKLIPDFRSFVASVNASLFFRELLHQSRHSINLTTGLFPRILPLLLRHFENFHYSGKEKVDAKALCSFILKCRTICRSWEYGVDWFYKKVCQSHVVTRESFMATQGKLKYTNIKVALLHYRRKPEHYNEFLGYFAATHTTNNRSPFVQRSISTNLFGQGYRNGITNMLQVYGAHLWEVNISIQHSLQYHAMMRHLCEVLQETPNLRKLYIAEYSGCYNYQVPKRKRGNPNLELVPFPNLPHLTVLDTYGLPPYVLHGLLTCYANTLKSLKVDHEFDPISPVEFPNLTRLRMHAYREGNLFLVEHAKKLETLAVNFRNDKKSWTMPQIFRHLEEKLANTLTTLVLYLPKMANIKTCLTARLSLPQVRNLKVQLQNWMPINFLMPMSSNLQALCVELHVEKEEESSCGTQILKKEEIKFLTCLESMDNSNIWQLSPDLKFVKIVIMVKRVRTDKSMVWIREGEKFVHNVWESKFTEDFISL